MLSRVGVQASLQSYFTSGFFSPFVSAALGTIMKGVTERVAKIHRKVFTALAIKRYHKDSQGITRYSCNRNGVIGALPCNPEKHSKYFQAD
jgi:hypothetical protein